MIPKNDGGEEMRKVLLPILAMAMLSVTGCSFMTGYEAARALSEDVQDEQQVMTADGYGIQVTLSGEWSRQEDTAFDLQCVYSDEEAYASFFYYYYIDMLEGTTAEDIFEIQNQDIIDKRDNVKIVEDVSERTSGDKTIRSIVFSAERNGSKNYYYANLVEFGKEADQFAWVLFTSIPSDMEQNRAEYNQILDSMEYTGEGQTL